MRLFKLYSLYLLAFVLVGLGFPACKDKPEPATPVGKQVSDYDYQAVYSWNELFLKVERYAAGYRPGPAPRAMAYIGLANYEACVSGMPDYFSVAPLYAGLHIPAIADGQEYHWPTVVNASYASMMRQFFSAAAQDKQDSINALEAANELKYQSGVDAGVIARSKQYGQAVAAAVWEWAKTDNIGHNYYLDPFDTANYDWNNYFSSAGDWVPTPSLTAAGTPPMFPRWGQVRTFAIRENDKLCPAPLAYKESADGALYAQALEVYARSTHADDNDVWMGQFWSDDLVNLTFSPGPRWLAITDEVLHDKQSNLETALFASVKVGMAVNDCSVACWHEKYKWNVERPVSYIKRMIDSTYATPLNNPLNGQKGVTPSFPAYPSGHATMGAGAAEVLTDLFGIHYAMMDRCHEGRTEFRGEPRPFNSFYEMADENAESRIPLGVHFRMDTEVGYDLGLRVGRRVNELPWKK